MGSSFVVAVMYARIRRGCALPDALPEVLKFLWRNVNFDFTIGELNAHATYLLEKKCCGVVEVLWQLVPPFN